MSAAETYTKEVHQKLERYATWLPTDKIAVGDLGFLRGDRFYRIAHLNDFEIPLPSTSRQNSRNLINVAAQRQWRDGPKALAGVRNQLVHPSTHQGLPYYDAWRLAEWYVELVLLHMLSVQGEYTCRSKHRWVGVGERVPWE